MDVSVSAVVCSEASTSGKWRKNVIRCGPLQYLNLQRMAIVERTYEYCPLYKRDLQRIIELMAIDGEPPEIHVGEDRFDTPDALFEYLGERGARKLKLHQRANGATVEKTGWLGSELTLTSYDHDDAQIVRFHRLDELLRACRKRAKGGFDVGWAFLSLASAMLGLGAATKSVNEPLQFIPYSVIALFGAVTLARRILRYYRQWTQFYGVENPRTFWTRSRDGILSSVIAALITASILALYHYVPISQGASTKTPASLSAK